MRSMCRVVLAVFVGVPLCAEAQANAGTCSSASQIGETIVSVGVGNDPYTVTGGKVYLTGPYDGAPFGLSIVTPAVAGPFNLGYVIVRAKIEVDPHTAQVSVDPTASEPIPHILDGIVTVTTGEIPRILDGIPLQVKQIYADINRPGFTFNPTSCEKMTVTGSVDGWEGTATPCPCHSRRRTVRR
jgi:hypothetical protein